MKRAVEDYIHDIIDAMEYASGFTKEMTYSDFSNDQKTIYAVLRAVEVIGEATKNIPEEIRTEYPEIPWKDMAGMRDKVIHEYFGIGIERVWLTVREDIPEIKPLIEKVLDELNQ